MKKHYSSIIAVIVALSFVSGTVGCRNTGGPWYNPKSYAWTNPFSKDSKELSSSEKKPSLDSYPNIEVPSEGYTDSSYASRSRVASGQADWGQNPSAGSTSPSSHLASFPYSVAPMTASGNYPSQSQPTQSQYLAESSSPSSYGIGQGVAPSSYQYPSSQNYAPSQSNDAQYPIPQYQAAQGGYPIQNNNDGYAAATQYVPTAEHVPYNSQGASTAGNYAPFDATPQSDPYSMAVQPSPYSTSSSTSSAYGSPSQQLPSPPPYQNSEIPAASPYPPYTQSGSMYNY